MAGNIKGVTIEFRGDTTKLDSALRQINNETKAIDKELRQVDKALKFNPTSVELWRQKQQLLTQKISETKEKLSLLKAEQARMDAAGVDKNSEEYRKLQREIIETESKLKTFESQLRKIGNVNLKALSEQFKEAGTRLQDMGRQMQGVSMAATAVVASLGAVAYKAGVAADDLNTMSKVYSIGTKDLQMYKAAADLVDVSVETIAKSHVKLEKNMLSASQGSKNQAAAFEALGVSITNADGSLRDGDSVWQDTIAALGRMENETERDAYAMQLMGKSASELNPLIEDGGETYKSVAETMQKYGLDFVDQETLDKANEFNDSLDTMKLMGTVALQSIGSQLAAYLAPALEKVVGWVGQFVNWLSQLDPALLTVIGVIASVLAVLAPVLIVVGKLATGIGAIINLVAIVGPIIAGLSGPFLIIIGIITAVIAIGVLLYKNWDTIKAKALELWANIKTAFNNIKTSITSTINTVKSFLTSAWNTIKSAATTAWNAIKTAITSPITNAMSTIKGIIDKIKNFFPISIGKVMSNLKLPHFKLSGKFSIDPPSVPHISVSWYKTGGIFDSPSVIGVGEAGPEAVVPIDTLWDKLDKIAESSIGDNVTINVYASPGMDINELAAKIEARLVALQKQRNKAWAY